jgi:hypothetical protein
MIEMMDFDGKDAVLKHIAEGQTLAKENAQLRQAAQGAAGGMANAGGMADGQGGAQARALAAALPADGGGVSGGMTAPAVKRTR